jgi:hypothetical protein
VLVVAEGGVAPGVVALAGTDVVGVEVLGVLVVAMCILADAGIFIPRSFFVEIPAAWAPAGVSAVSAHAAATISAVGAWRKLRLGLTVIAFAMLTPAPLLGVGLLTSAGTNIGARKRASPTTTKL